MSIWFHKDLTAEKVQKFNDVNVMKHLGIIVTDISDESLTCEMKVEKHHCQPFDIMHGGVSCVIAETVASMAGNLTLDNSKQMAVGLEINANHLSPGQIGETIVGVASPIRRGATSQVWNIDLHEKDSGRRVCVSRMTLAVTKRR